MNRYIKTVSNYIEEQGMIGPGEGVLAAVSGGADSMCMLSILSEYCRTYGIRLGVVSVDHGFRVEAAREQEYVGKWCRGEGIPFYPETIPQGACESTEEAARIYRYKLIDAVADREGYDKIALAHNANDRAETLLFNMFRGTGIRGLSSIRPVRDRYIRPVLCLKREEIEDYLEDREIAFCTDSSNLSDDYSRNQIRHHILPLSQQINAGSIGHMNAVADRCGELEDYVSRVTEDLYEKHVTKDGQGVRIEAKVLADLDKLICGELIRRMIFDMTPHLKDITAEHISSIRALALRPDNGRADLPYAVTAYREYEYIYISNIRPEDTLPCRIADREVLSSGEELRMDLPDGSRLIFRLIDGPGRNAAAADDVPRNKYTKWFDYDKIMGSLVVRSRAAGDRLTIDNEGHTKSVGRLLIESKIPERKRETTPVIAADKDVLWVVGLRDSCSYRIDKNTSTVLEINWEE